LAVNCTETEPARLGWTPSERIAEFTAERPVIHALPVESSAWRANPRLPRRDSKNDKAQAGGRCEGPRPSRPACAAQDSPSAARHAAKAGSPSLRPLAAAGHEETRRKADSPLSDVGMPGSVEGSLEEPQ